MAKFYAVVDEYPRHVWSPMSSPVYTIAGWRFDPAEPVLRNDVRTLPLEDRVARTLEMLCEHRGAIVSKDALIARVWEGRTVSPNSVSIVIGALRRALDDDLQAPVHIVTVARRGYRLTDEVPTTTPPREARRLAKAWVLLTLGITAIVGTGVILRPAVGPVVVAVDVPENATGRADFDRLAVSLAPVVVAAAARLDGVQVRDVGAGSSRIVPRVRLRSKLILWAGAPELALDAIDTQTHAVIWTGFAPGPPALLARHASAKIATLEAHVPR